MLYIRSNDNASQRISSAQLRAALDDPRLPDSFCVEVSPLYPALIIRTDETDTEDPDGYWYIGYIDLFDAEYHPRERGERDGINTTYGDLVYVSDPELTRKAKA